MREGDLDVSFHALPPVIVRDDQEATTPWVRRGECTGCGWCCQFLGRRIMKFTGKTDDYDRPYLELRGARMGPDRTGEAEIGIHLPCTAHDNDAKCCTVYETRPRTCRDFPWDPAQVRGTPCSFWFERTVSGRVERVAGDGAPDAAAPPRLRVPIAARVDSRQGENIR